MGDGKQTIGHLIQVHTALIDFTFNQQDHSTRRSYPPPLCSNRLETEVLEI